ncbi:MAG: hypothetical protein RJA70_4098 [Pseudomonadota bacterium]
MLFNSYEFLLGFLPITAAVFFAIGSRGWVRAAIGWLVAASLFYYAWWNPIYLVLVVLSLSANFLLGLRLSASWQARQEGRPERGKQWLLFGLALNLGLLAYYKYAAFFIDNVNSVTGLGWAVPHVVLPLGISFFTFQKIAFLVDSHRGAARELRFTNFCLFVVFFPQLIAGPIVHHAEILPQFDEPRVYRPDATRWAVGLTLLAIGLFKKAIIADGVSGWASPVFHAAAEGSEPTLLSAWGGALSYSFQLYFDFSGYSDMAIGIGHLFGIALPLNFHSPYKSRSIVEFWRTWHITLSRFLRMYLYIPLGGNRHGGVRRYVNLLSTMLLGGLWHGAGWTYVIWGALHGTYLCINHAWEALGMSATSRAGRAAARALTFLAVVVGWVFFRADNPSAALAILAGMMGLNGVEIPLLYSTMLAKIGVDGSAWVTPLPGFNPLWEPPVIAGLLVAVWALPNTQEILAHYKPALDHDGLVERPTCLRWWHWRPSNTWAVLTAFVFLLSLLSLTRVTEFLYFQF